MKTIRQQWILYLCLVILVTITMLCFSTSTSPLFPNSYGWDSAYYRFFGASLLKGKELYTDIWDNKGPVFYFIQALGALHGTRNEKISLIFPMQILSMLISIHFLNLTDTLVSKEKYRQFRFFLLTAIGLSVFSALTLYEPGNVTEEWSFPMICCSLYFFAKYAVNNPDTAAKTHPKHYSFIHGICLALIAFIRLNNAISICSGVLIIGIYLMIRKQWKNLFENILFGFLGLLTVTLPVCLYFLLKNALGTMLYSVFVYNFQINGQRTHITLPNSIFITRFLPIFFTCLLLPVFVLRAKKIRLIDAITAMIILSNGILLLINNIYWHYFMIYVPVLLFSLILYTKFSHIPEVILTLIFSVFYVQNSVYIAKMNLFTETHPSFPTVNKFLPKAERNSMIAINVNPEIYLNTGLFPCSRFAAFQDIHFADNPEFEKEFISDLQTENPKWIAISCSHDEVMPFVRELIDSHYEYRFSDAPYCFYRLTEPE